MKLKRLRFIGYGLGLILAGLLTYLLLFVVTTEKRLVIGSYESLTEKPFYTLPSPLPEGQPGQLLRSERLASVPDGMIGWRVLYYSTDKDGNSIVTSGLVAAPDTRGDSPRKVIGWGHPTTGTTERCAPSVGYDPFDTIEGLRDLVKAGYVVAAPDYSGMGLAGPPSFLIGETEGRNLLDAVRASRHLPEANAGKTVTTWGHSQGGHAALFAAQIAKTYAPDLTITGVAAAAPATNLSELLKADIGDVSGVSIGGYAMNAYSTAYNIPLETILTPAAVAATPTMAQLCLLGQNSKLHEYATPLIGNYFAKDPTTTQPWAVHLQQNTPGQDKITIPLYVAQGDSDTLIHPSITQSFVDHQRSLGANVTYQTIPDTGHGMVALRAIPSLLTWLKTLP